MRTYYLFELNDYILKNFKYEYDKLYDILESIHYLKLEDAPIAYDIYYSLITKIDRDFYNKIIKKNNISNESYICYDYTHTINDYFDKENSKLIINKSFMKIKTNKNMPTFFYDISSIKNIFVCDFKSRDYFLIKDIIYTSCFNI